MDGLFLKDPVTGVEHQIFDYNQSPERGGSGVWDVVRSEMGRIHFDLTGDIEYVDPNGNVIETKPFAPRNYDTRAESSDIPPIPGHPEIIFE